MGWPEITWITLTCIGLGMTFSQHGQPKEGKENGWVSLFATALVTCLLWAGGFFS
jgi:hypothetical protein